MLLRSLERVCKPLQPGRHLSALIATDSYAIGVLISQAAELAGCTESSICLGRRGLGDRVRAERPDVLVLDRHVDELESDPAVHAAAEVGSCVMAVGKHAAQLRCYDGTSTESPIYADHPLDDIRKAIHDSLACRR